MQVIAAYSSAINATNLCAAAAVRTNLAPGSQPGSQAGVLACTVHVPGGRAGNLCP
jgi:hypothetical protein